MINETNWIEYEIVRIDLEDGLKMTDYLRRIMDDLDADQPSSDLNYGYFTVISQSTVADEIVYTLGRKVENISE